MWLLDTALYSPYRQALNNTRGGEQILPARLLNWLASSKAERRINKYSDLQEILYQ